jgi:hypothetical protein
MGAKIKTALRKSVYVAGTVLGVLFVIAYWANSLLGPLMVQRAPAQNELSAQEVVALDGHVSCMSYRDWYVTSVSGPCSDFKAPANLRIGEHFSERGVDHQIHIILATHIEKDDPKNNWKAGDWYCEIAESEADLDHWEGKQWRRTWLFIPKCDPIR